MFNSGFHCLSKLAFKCSVIQQWETFVLESMLFEALSCKGGASISICTSRALILRVLVWHLGLLQQLCYLVSLLMVLLVYPLIHTFSILSLQLKKLR